MFAKLFAKICSYSHDTDGATAIEYGLIAGGISLAIVAAVFQTIAQAMGNAQGRVELVQ